jgi:WD40 repeat protein
LSSGDDCCAKLWNIDTGALIQTFATHENWVEKTVFSGDGTKVLTTSTDYTAKLFRVWNGELICTYRHKGSLWDAQFWGNHDYVLTCGDVSCRIWGIEADPSPQPLVWFDGRTEILGVSACEAPFLASWHMEDHCAWVWDIANGWLHLQLQHHYQITDVTLFNGGQMALTASHDGK